MYLLDSHCTAALRPTRQLWLYPAMHACIQQLLDTGILYELPPDEAIMRIQVYHDSREESGAFDSPACEGQRKQVRRLMAKVMDGVWLAPDG